VLPILLVSLLFLSACDGGFEEIDRDVQASINLQFMEPTVLQEGEAAKRGSISRIDADYSTELRITSSSGDDFSPDPFTVSDTDGTARLTLPLPAGDLYTIEVSFSSGPTEVAKGKAIHYISRETKEINVPIIPFSPGAATIGFLPGNVQRSTEPEGRLTLDLEYFAGDTPIVGLACQLAVEGIDTSELTFEGADLIQIGSNDMGLSWAWTTPLVGDAVLGTLSIPLSAAASINLIFTDGDARSVVSGGAVTQLEAVGASVNILP
jgi:hypothetical protein